MAKRQPVCKWQRWNSKDELVTELNWLQLNWLQLGQHARPCLRGSWAVDKQELEGEPGTAALSP